MSADSLRNVPMRPRFTRFMPWIGLLGFITFMALRSEVTGTAERSVLAVLAFLCGAAALMTFVRSRR